MEKVNLVILVSVLLAIIFISGCIEQPVENEGANEMPPAKIGLAEIAQHSTAEDCWFAINEKVYDVTEYITVHPGGQAIVNGCGKDATELFETSQMGSGTPHSPAARNILEQYYIAELA